MRHVSHAAISTLALALAACATREQSTAPNVPGAAKATTPPTLDGNPNDAASAAAKPIPVALSDGAIFAGGTYYIVDGNQVPFGDTKFKPGDEVASFPIFPLKDDRADIKVATRWANGVLTSEVSRKLTTGSKLDVQFSGLNASYGFGFATFDNAQVRRAVHYEPLYLRSAK